MIGFWDVALVLVATMHATLLTYVSNPRWKTIVWMMPFTLTMSTLAVARPVDATHVLGLVLLLLFTHAARILHYNLRLPIVPSILLSAVGYCAIGWAAAGFVPTTNLMFWLSVMATIAMALAAMRYGSRHKEDGHKNLSPLWIKLPVIVAVVFVLVAIKRGLGGFMSAFPIVGVVAIYESRKCLWSVCQAMPAATLMLLSVFVASHLTQNLVGLGPSLVIGWGAFFCILGLRSTIPLLFASNRVVVEPVNAYYDGDN